MNANPILLQKKYSRVIERFARQQNISLDAALDFFYHSDVYLLIRDGVSDMHCMSDAYLTEELEQEYCQNNANGVNTADKQGNTVITQHGFRYSIYQSAEDAASGSRPGGMYRPGNFKQRLPHTAPVHVRVQGVADVELNKEKSMAAKSKKQPNILLIMTDQMRGDCLGIAGHPDVKTPYLDQLASQGAWFPNAYTAVPSCIAARCGLLTGLSPEHHGRVGYQDRVPWEYPVTMPGELAKAGYYTKCVGKMHVHPLRNLLGFHHIELHDGYLGSYRRSDTPFYEHQAVADDYFHWLRCELGMDRDVTDTGIEANSWVARPWPYEEKYHPTNWVTDRSLDFLRSRDRSKPFFLMTSFVRPHPPFDAPQCFFDLYRDKELTSPPVGDWADEGRLNRSGRVVDSDTGPIDPELLRQAQIGYYACISHVDNQVGRILMALADEGILQDTVILFCSDHGELLGDHHTYRKIRPYQGSIRVPMILFNGGLHGQQDNLVELRDLLPTFLELAGETAPECLDGISMLHPNGREYLHGEHSGGDIGNQVIVTKTDKYCWFTESGREQYFDLAGDPREMHDGIRDAANQERISVLRGHLIRELAEREEGYSDGTRLIPGRPQRAVLQRTLR